ncbi:MAG: hypothetical protein CV087_08465 [Candidatus Brocadia sp. WS118]|nr:MAG: hypothetical protein CV087_08465 [Candidatus Brocadia sp. WS118]
MTTFFKAWFITALVIVATGVKIEKAKSVVVDRQATKQETVAKVTELAKWCESNKQMTTASVLYAMSGALHANQDTLLMDHVADFSAAMIKIIERDKKLKEL